MAMLHSIPKVFTGVAVIDSIIQCILILAIVALMNFEKVKLYITSLTVPKNRSKICYSHNEMLPADIYYLGIHHYICVHCPNIQHLNKKGQKWYAYNTICRSKDYEICGADVHITDDIYFTTAISWIEKNPIKTITIYSKVHSVVYLKDVIQSWIDEYDTFLKCSLLTQSIVTIHFTKEKIIAKHGPWTSSATFTNRFFKDKQKIMDQLDYFINNKEWFSSKGIPHTMGILLHGLPGCGKTSFIKCLANKWPTKHIINIRLNDAMNLDDLEFIINSAHISDTLYVPLHNRIYVIEDIDCMMQLVKSREKKKDDMPSSDIVTKTDNEQEKNTSCDNKNDNKNNVNKNNNNNNNDNNNNLSYLLNILDGLVESDERILILTSNYPNRLDSALLRPGRIDINICFGRASRDELASILEHYWDTTSRTCIIDEICDVFTGAEISNICRSSTSMEDTIRNLQEKCVRVQSS